MKYNLFNNTKTIEINDELIKMYEDSIHTINSIILEGIITAENAEEKSEENMINIVLNAMLETVELYENTEVIFNKINMIKGECDL